ncbi:MAG TPA: hypothetical protein VLK83_00980 [Rhodanobacteraceae bacterium]|nr:hypothetical protein [Rhodanobacteraceae bacterium]
MAQIVEIDAEQSRDELGARVRLAVLARPRIRGDRFEALAGCMAGRVETMRQRRRQAFVVPASGPCARAGLAVDDETEDPIGAAQTLERFDFLVDPVRLRRVRRADHDQVRRLRERIADLGGKIGRARQLIAVAEHRRESCRDDAGTCREPDQPFRYRVAFERVMQPVRPGAVPVAVAQERLEPECSWLRSHVSYSSSIRTRRLTSRRRG